MERERFPIETSKTHFFISCLPYRIVTGRLMALAVEHSEDLDCWCHLQPGVARGQKLVERRRLGWQEEHDEWDTGDRLFICLETAVKVVFGEEEAKRPLMYRLLTQGQPK